MPSLYEKIQLGAKHGLYSLIQPEHGYFYLVTPFKDRNGYYRESGYGDSFEETLLSVAVDDGESKQAWKNVEKVHKFIRYVSHAEIIKPEPYKVGDLVDVLEIAKENPDYESWQQARKNMVGEKGLEIESVHDDYVGLHYTIYKKDKPGPFFFRHEWLAPHIPEDGTMNLSEEEQEMIQTLREKGFKIIKE